MKTQENTETMIFLNLLNDECKCQWFHNEEGCSEQVTHIYSDCQFELLICDLAFQWIVKLREWKIRHLAVCQQCNLPADKCWSIRPV